MSPPSAPEGSLLWVEIDLDGLRTNARRMVARAGGARVLAVVKADAYGHGAVAAARAFRAGGVAAFGVFLVEEAEELREAGIGEPILLLGPLPPGREGRAVELGLTPTVHCLEGAEALEREGAARRRRLPYHLKVDTGMGRLGVPAAQLSPFLAALRAHPHLEMQGLYTHLACAEESDDALGPRQLALFREAIAQVRQAGHAPAMIHVSNSAHLLRSPTGECNVVRPGLALYGYSPAPGVVATAGVRPALSLRCRVVQVKRVPAGATLGYGATWTAARDSVIATLPVGYQEGYRRELGNRASALVGGRRAPVAGRISMDLTTLDVTDLPEVRAGDLVTLLGEDGDDRIDAWELAGWAGTVAWDVLCGIDRNVARLLLGGDAVAGAAGSGTEPS